MRAMIVVAAAACMACQRYVEVAAAPVPPTGDIRLVLSENVASEALGPVGTGVSRIAGNVLGTTDSTINLAVSQLTRRSGYEESWQGETVLVPRRGVLRFERKQISMPRTLATVGAFVAGSFLARGMIGGGENTPNGTRKPGGGN
ncbi:MAG TPA: hypothetical protein VGD02_01930 [Gemmatimonadaceae bacterium]